MKVLIIGAGKLGYKLASSLALADDADITIVDKRPEVLEHISDHLDVMTVHANGIHVSSLKELDVPSYDLAVACSGNDEVNIICGTLLKRMGCDNVVVRMRNMEYVEHRSFIQDLMDIDLAVNPELSTAKQISGYLMKNYSFHTNNFALGRVSLVDVLAKRIPKWVGRPLKDIEGLREFVLVGIGRGGDLIIPDGNTVIEENDVLYIMGRTDRLDQISGSMGRAIEGTLKNVMIVGGGRVGYHLAKRLSLKGIRIKLIERDPQQCAFLAENLGSNVLVLNADGSDNKVLMEEEIFSMDAFVGATGYDEENLLMCLGAKQMNVPKVVAKVSRNNYTDIIESLGVDAIFSTIDITASEILKYVRGGKILSVSLLLGGKAEVNEYIADAGMPIVGRPLSEVNIPKGNVVGAMLSGNNEVIIPNGNTVIQPGDRFVVFSMTNTLPKFRKCVEIDRQ
ncbi:MAG: Trk system potassium transporter TrkA [Eubacteriales bacterium]|jgi:trk system potassium uptake protein TrkA